MLSALSCVVGTMRLLSQILSAIAIPFGLAYGAWGLLVGLSGSAYRAWGWIMLPLGYLCALSALVWWILA